MTSNQARLPPSLIQPQHTPEDEITLVSSLSQDQRSVSSIERIAAIWSQSKSLLTGQVTTTMSNEEENDQARKNNPSSVRLDENPPLAEEPEKCDDPPSVHPNHWYDSVQDMTWGRRIALTLMDSSWYNPRAWSDKEFSEEQEESDTTPPAESTRAAEAYPFSYSKRERPSLEKAWAYFEHVTLPRYILEVKDAVNKKPLLVRIWRRVFRKGRQLLERAEPGETDLPTKLYHPIWTPHGQLGDFGLGLGLYFSMLRALFVLTLLAGILNIANLKYFSSNEYSQGQTDVQALLRGSAICTDQKWVICTDCDTAGDWKDDRIAVGVSKGNTNVTFALRNQCDGPTIQQGMINYATLIFVVIGIVILNRYMKRMEVAFDEDMQTAQDYSIVVENPPPDATDPSEWRNYFKDSFDGAWVTAITVAVDNDLLIRCLVERREVLRKIEMKVEPGTSLDILTLAGIATKEERERRFLGHLMARVLPGIPELVSRLVVLTAKIQGLSQQDYPVSNVFVTFEKESDQRKVLSGLSIGKWATMRNNSKALSNPLHLFRGKHVLAVSEPDEPNTIRWQDLNEKFKERLKQQSMTILCTCAAIALIAFIVRIANNSSNTVAAFVIAIFNSVFPMFAKALTDMEAHSSEGDKQRSLYVKIAFFRWVNTAVVITIITPFTSTLTDGKLINQIFSLFYAEIITSNALQLGDVMGHINRHYFAPRAKTQDAQNILMQGSPVDLAERYTNCTKILFLALWYCAIYPGALFMCSFALLVNYFADRFSLMRSWKRPPHLGTEISEVSRKYFFSLTIVAMAVVSSYYWSAFPYDNLCKNVSTVESDLAGTYEIYASGSGPISVNVSSTDSSFRYCLQDFFRYPRNEKSFPFIANNQPNGNEWMTDEQEIVTNIYGWSAVGVLALVLLSFAWRLEVSLRGFFYGTYEPCGDDQEINFSDVASISSYVPQVVSSVFSYPLLACSIDNIDEYLLEWTDPDKPYTFYDLTKDAKVLLRGTDVSEKKVFSQIAHYPPETKKNQ